MNDQQSAVLFEQLARIANALETLARASASEQPEPNYIKPLADYTAFDWASIGASIVAADPDGPTHVEWNGALYTRRSPVNKFEPALWFSRAAGKDAEGIIKYLRLITFREIKDADPINPKLVLKPLAHEIAAAANSTARSPAPAAERTANTPTPAPAAQSGKNGNGLAPAASQAGAPPSAAREITSTTYYVASRYNGFTSTEAADIAHRAGIDTKQRGVNFFPAHRLLPFLLSARAAGLTIADAWQILVDHNHDLTAALKALT